jgi:hypothetical protein
MTSKQCERFPNTWIHASARRIGRGEFAGQYRATIRTIEYGAWRPYVSRFSCQIVRTSRADAMADALAAMNEAAASGYVPAPFKLA